MSEHSSDGVSISTSSVPRPKKRDKSSDLELGEVSKRDKVWNKHKANNDLVAYHYRDSEFHEYAQRMSTCSEMLEFRLVPSEAGVYSLKLGGARFCHVRHCPICQWRRALRYKARAYQALPRVVADHPGSRWLFMTLTLRNCELTQLRQTINLMHESFVRMTKLKDWPAEGWIKSLEVTRGKDGSAHPHFHCLLMVKPSYFSGPNYLSSKKWSELWAKSLRIDYHPVTHVKAIAKHHDPRVIIPECLKYTLKESDLTIDREWLIELTHQMHKVKAISVGGVLRKYMKQLEQEPQDLIGDEGEREVDEGKLYCNWRRLEKKYRFKNTN